MTMSHNISVYLLSIFKLLIKANWHTAYGEIGKNL